MALRRYRFPLGPVLCLFGTCLLVGGIVVGCRASKLDVPLASRPVARALQHAFATALTGPEIEALTLQTIAGAKSSILCQWYEFTHPGYCDALIAALERGVKVVLVNDPSGAASKYWQGHRLFAAGADVRIDHEHSGICHRKLMLVDGLLTLSGSANATEAAVTVNVEVCYLFAAKYVYDAHLADFQIHHAHSEPLTP